MKRSGSVARIAVAAAAASALLSFVGVRAQENEIDEALLYAMDGEQATPEELLAWRYAERMRFVKALELATRIVERHPRSYVGHFVLGFVEHYGEGNFPRALFHYETALGGFEARHGATPSPDEPTEWHRRMLIELAATHGDLEHHAEKVVYLDRHNGLYDPDLLADRAWPLMKMGMFDRARSAAREGVDEGSPRQLEVALNALCAIEFESGNDGVSYDACRAALDYGRTQPGGANAVDLTNFSEAARSLFKLDEAERIALEATEAEVAWYGNPWLELGELYTREARFAEALNALKRVPEYRAQRPPHVRDADRNEGRRVLSSFYLLVGRPRDALDITEKALVAPDRRAHQSRDPNQDLAIAAMLDRRARLVSAEELMEEAAAHPFWENVPRWAESAWLRFEAWTSGRRAARLLADDDRLVGSLRIGTARGAIVPPWLAGELVDVVGAGVVREAIRRARAEDERDGAGAYYNAFAAEAALASGDDERAGRLAVRALDALGPAEALLRARVDAIAAEALWREGERREALHHYEAAFAADPGVFRRMDLAVPVRVTAEGGVVAGDVADAIGWSPRFFGDDDGLLVRISSDGTRGEACLVGVSGGVLGCAELSREAAEEEDVFARRLSNAFHHAAFAPRIDLSQADVSSLDGSNRTARDPLEGLDEANEEPWQLDE